MNNEGCVRVSSKGTLIELDSLLDSLGLRHDGHYGLTGN